MTTLHRARNWKLQVFGREHGAPHFHGWTPTGAAVVALDKFQVLSGSVDVVSLREAKAWAMAHRTAIAAEWKRLNPEKSR